VRAVNGLLALHRHKTWATLRLIEHCQELDDDHLDATMPGTYGTIRDTLRHLVHADEDYLSMLTGDPWPEPMSDRPIPLDELADRIRRLGPRWEALAEDRDLANREAVADDGVRMPSAVPMAQAIHHADDHRTHVLSILGARGLEVPDLDVWAYAESQGMLWAPEEAPGG
jgi:uncharacterized damage-inducible protein DinB